MSMTRRFHGQPVTRLIVSVPEETVAQIDELLDWRAERKHPARGNRSEYVRLAIFEKLQRDRGM